MAATFCTAFEKEDVLKAVTLVAVFVGISNDLFDPDAFVNNGPIILAALMIVLVIFSASNAIKIIIENID